MNTTKCIFVTLMFSILVFAQAETLTNAEIIEMSSVGLGKQLILSKINTSNSEFDVSTKGIIELKKANVDEEIIAKMLEKSESKRQRFTQSEEKKITVGTSTITDKPTNFGNSLSPSDMLKNAKTIALVKDSIHPNKQNLEKAQLKRTEWSKFNLSITEYKETADLFVEISFVHFSIITHRYVYRIYDRRSGTVLAAGETTSWGCLSNNLAKNIVKSLNKISEVSSKN
jgi:hypothetical protein